MSSTSTLFIFLGFLIGFFIALLLREGREPVSYEKGVKDCLNNRASVTITMSNDTTIAMP